MKSRFFLRTLLLLALLALLGVSLGAASTALAATGSASPAQAGPGTRVHFSATGFAPGERVDFWVSSPSGHTQPRYPSVTADASGTVVWSWDVAAGDTNGAWTMSARGIQSGTALGIPFTARSAGKR